MDIEESKADEIVALLTDIRANTRTTWQELLIGGILKGVGIVLGSALSVTLAGWALTALGVIPGADDIAEYLSQVLSDTVSLQD